MITGELKSQVDKIWEAFWTGGISNPLSVIEQFTYLLFIRRLDERQLLEEKKANTVGVPLQNEIFSPEQKELRWSSFKNKQEAAKKSVKKRLIYRLLSSMKFTVILSPEGPAPIVVFEGL